MMLISIQVMWIVVNLPRGSTHSCDGKDDYIIEPSTHIRHHCSHYCRVDNPLQSPIDCQELCPEYYVCIMRVFLTNEKPSKTQTMPELSEKRALKTIPSRIDNEQQPSSGLLSAVLTTALAIIVVVIAIVICRIILHRMTLKRKFQSPGPVECELASLTRQAQHQTDPEQKRVEIQTASQDPQLSDANVCDSLTVDSWTQTGEYQEEYKPMVSQGDNEAEIIGKKFPRSLESPHARVGIATSSKDQEEKQQERQREKQQQQQQTQQEEDKQDHRQQEHQPQHQQGQSQQHRFQQALRTPVQDVLESDDSDSPQVCFQTDEYPLNTFDNNSHHHHHHHHHHQGYNYHLDFNNRASHLESSCTNETGFGYPVQETGPQQDYTTVQTYQQTLSPTRYEDRYQPIVPHNIYI